MLQTLIMVALGGAFGAVLRFGVGLWVGFPWGTFVVNVLGSFLIGAVWVALTSRAGAEWMPFVMVGLLGGFTTFSTFSLDTLRLIEAGQGGLALVYGLGSVLASLAACGLGIWLAREALV